MSRPTPSSPQWNPTDPNSPTFSPRAPSYPTLNPPAGEPRSGHSSASYLLAGLAIGVALTVLIFYALGGHLGALSSSPSSSGGCPSSTFASIGSANETGPPVSADSVSVESDAWAAGATSWVVTHPIAVTPGSTLLVFVGWVGAEVGGPSDAVVCDSTGDTFFADTTTSAVSSNHSQVMFLAFDVHGGAAVSIATNFSDTSAAAGGVVSVVDLNSSVTLSLNTLVVGSNDGVGTSASVILSATASSFFVFSVTGQGNAGPYAAIGTETLLATNGYFDAGPWTDGESFGTFVGTAPSGTVDYGANLASGPYVWDAIAVLVD